MDWTTFLQIIILSAVILTYCGITMFAPCVNPTKDDIVKTAIQMRCTPSQKEEILLRAKLYYLVDKLPYAEKSASYMEEPK
jgi:hypothetical protein